MSAAFDPYYTWLGIPPQEQPPSHYRLLGIRALEDNRDVITHAMDQRMAHLRTLQSGKHAEVSQKLLNEVSAAAVVLLEPVKKEEYDRALRGQLAVAAAKSAAPVPVPPPAPAPLAAPPVAGKPAAIAMPLLAAGAIAGTVAALLLVLVALAVIRSWSASDPVAKGAGTSTTPTASDSSAVAPAAEHQPEQTPGETNRLAAAPAISQPPPMPATPSKEKKVTEPSAAASAVEQPTTTTPASSSPPPDASATSAVPPTSTAPPPLSEATVPEPAEPTSARPTPAEMEEARAKVLAIYGEEARQAGAPEQKRALADKLAQVAGETSNDPAVKFVLLDAARKLYVAAGEIDQTLSTVSALSEEFDEGLRPLQIDSLSTMAELALPADRRDQLASALLELTNEAVADEDFAAADELAKLAVRVSGRTGDLTLRRAIVQKRSDLTRLKNEFHAVVQARQKLATDPGDQGANLVIGKFLCFVVADFEQGVPYLALSGKEPFLAAAAADQAAVSGLPEHFLQAGDAWLGVAESLRTSDKAVATTALIRTRHWYEKVLPLLSGLDRARVEKRLQSIGADSAPSLQAADKSSAKTKVKKGNKKSKRGGKAVVEQAAPGLIGRAATDNRDVGLLLTYQPGHRITTEEITDLQSQLGAGQRRVEFTGVLSLSVDASVSIHHAGGSSSGGVHRLFLDGEEVHAVGDDRTKDENITMSLRRGEHLVSWVLSGGELGSALLEFRVVGSKLQSKPDIFYSRQQDAAARAVATRREITYGQ